MKRALLLLLGVLGMSLILAFAGATSAAPSLQATCPPFVNCLPSPVPPGGFNPGDPDGDGIPNGIDLCPEQGGPSSNSGCPPGVAPPNGATATSAPNIAAPVTLPTLPTSGECVLATRSGQGVNIRAEPSIHADILGVLDPQMSYLVFVDVDNADGVWERIAQGWVAERVVRHGGDCDAVPLVDEPDAPAPTPVVSQLTLPTVGECQVYGPEGAYVHSQPSHSSHSNIILDPLLYYHVYNIVSNAEGTWYNVDPYRQDSWVHNSQVHLLGDCGHTRVADEPGAAASTPVASQFTLPTAGDCRVGAYLTTPILLMPYQVTRTLGFLKFGQRYYVYATLSNDEGTWYLVAPTGAGWVQQSRVQRFGDCDALPVIGVLSAADTITP